MLLIVLRLFIGFIGFAIGYGAFRLSLALELIAIPNELAFKSSAAMIFSLTGGILFLVFSGRPAKKIKLFIEKLETDLESYSVSDLIYGTSGLIAGLIIAFFISMPILKLQYFGFVTAIFIYIILGSIGLSVSIRKRRQLNKTNGKNSNGKFVERSGGIPKIVDTSSIIDGRIADICKTGFVEGPLIIPNFVLTELQHIADSPDHLKRRRGRRGLDTLKLIQTELPIEVIISYDDYDDIAEVDAKLIRMAQEMGGHVITNDFNLNKVADVQGLVVLNINELANAIKTVLLPGEEMSMLVLKEGKEHGQGIGYLDDGTMIVIEDGKNYIGQEIEVVVTSVLQTPAGKMIFVRPKYGDE